jgi:hypothetical protein
MQLIQIAKQQINTTATYKLKNHKTFPTVTWQQKLRDLNHSEVRKRHHKLVTQCIVGAEKMFEKNIIIPG